MTKFFYTAKHVETGKSTGGTIEAKSQDILAKQMRAQGYVLTSIQEEKGEKKTSSFSFLRGGIMSVPLKEKMVFARNLGVMVESGLPLMQAIHALQEQTKNKGFKKVLVSVEESIHAGHSLADALAMYPQVFNELFVNMVRVGEIGGNLEEVLNIVATQMEKEHALISKVRGAMIYPAVIMVAMIGVGIIMLTYILPQILGVFEGMDVELPVMTQFIIAISDLLREQALLVSAGFFVCMGMVYAGMKTEGGKRMLSWIVLHLPVIRDIVIKVNCARFTRIYSSLLKSGVGVVDALAIIEKTLSNRFYRDALAEGKTQIQKGVEISTVIADHKELFPVLVLQIFRVGEQTGKTEDVLLKVAVFYEDEVDQITKNLSSIVEPVLMLLIGSAVGFFAVSMLQPMYSVLNNI